MYGCGVFEFKSAVDESRDANANGAVLFFFDKKKIFIAKITKYIMIPSGI
jgi:hypothetical protein